MAVPHVTGAAAFANAALGLSGARLRDALIGGRRSRARAGRADGHRRPPERGAAALVRSGAHRFVERDRAAREGCGHRVRQLGGEERHDRGRRCATPEHECRRRESGAGARGAGALFRDDVHRRGRPAVSPVAARPRREQQLGERLGARPVRRQRRRERGRGLSHRHDQQRRDQSRGLQRLRVCRAGAGRTTATASDVLGPGHLLRDQRRPAHAHPDARGRPRHRPDRAVRRPLSLQRARDA